MTQSLPKGSLSSRPPSAAVDRARLTTALAAGGAVLLLSGTAVVLWPRTYGAESTIVIDGGARVPNPIALASRVEAALLAREQLAAVAMELPPELRSPDPIGRLRGGIRVISRGALGYAVEFRGSDPVSVRNITNRLSDRAVALIPKLAAAPTAEDAAVAKELGLRSRAVTEFLAAHPEITVEQAPGRPAPTSSDRALDVLRTEKHDLELRLTETSGDNPYGESGETLAHMSRRLIEIKNTIGAREAALKRQSTEGRPSISLELQERWRVLLAELSEAQKRAAELPTTPALSAHVTARAPLPSSPLTPNRGVLSLVALLLSLAAGMLAYVLPRRALAPAPRRPLPRSDPPPEGTSAANVTASPNAITRNDPPRRSGARTSSMPPPERAVSEPPIGAPAPQESDPPPPNAGPALGSVPPPGPMAPQRPVVLSSSSPPPRGRASTVPGGINAPALKGSVPGAKPPPGAGSYSVSSSRPPAPDARGESRTAVERLSPLQSAHPPLAAASNHSAPPSAAADAPQISSRPPALDPEAERWAARFENPPPPPSPAPPAPAPEPRAGRWKTQVMGSMVPLEVLAAREGARAYDAVQDSPRATSNESASGDEPSASVAPPPNDDRGPTPPRALAISSNPPVPAANVRYCDVPYDWAPSADLVDAHVTALRDAVTRQGLNNPLSVVVTGLSQTKAGKAQAAAGLALSLAEAGARVLLVEADFDGPELHQVLALSPPAHAGFSQQLKTRAHRSEAQPWVLMRCSADLHVLAEGRFRAPGLLRSREFDFAIAELRLHYHVLILSGPPLTAPTELAALDGLAHAAVIADGKQPPSIQFGHHVLRAFV